MNDFPAPPPEGELITAARERARLSVREAARRAGISEGWWRQIVKGYQTLSGGGYGLLRGPAETVARMAQVVEVTPQQLEDAGRPDAANELRALERPAPTPTVEEGLERIERALRTPGGRAALRSAIAGLEAQLQITDDPVEHATLRRLIARLGGPLPRDPEPDAADHDKRAG